MTKRLVQSSCLRGEFFAYRNIKETKRPPGFAEGVFCNKKILQRIFVKTSLQKVEKTSFYLAFNIILIGIWTVGIRNAFYTPLKNI